MEVFLICFIFVSRGAFCVSIVDLFLFTRRARIVERDYSLQQMEEDFLMAGRMCLTPFYTSDRLAFGWLCFGSHDLRI